MAAQFKLTLSVDQWVRLYAEMDDEILGELARQQPELHASLIAAEEESHPQHSHSRKKKKSK